MMDTNVLIAGADPDLGMTLFRQMEESGLKADLCNTVTGPLPEPREVGVCVAYWTHRASCPVDFLRRLRRENPGGSLLCWSERPDPAERAFLLGSHVNPDVLLSPVASADALVSKVRALLALQTDATDEYLVLCVDDDKEFLWSLEQFLPQTLRPRVPFELSFEYVDDPFEAESVLSETAAPRDGSPPLAMIVSDHVMPGMDGVELLSRARRIAPGASRLLLTGQAGMDAVVRAVNDHVLDQYIAKPIEDSVAFGQTLAHMLREHHLAAACQEESQRTFEQYEFLRRLARMNTLGDTLQAVVEFVAQALDARRVSLMLREGSRLVVRASKGLPASVARGSSMPLDAGVAGRVFRDGVPMCVADGSELKVETSASTPYSAFASVPVLVTPMSCGTEPIGVINVTNRKHDRPLTRGEMMFLSHAADAASIAIRSHLERLKCDRANFRTIRSLALAVEAKDRFARGHSERVAKYAVKTAKQMGLDRREVGTIQRAAILHDIGKIGTKYHVPRTEGGLDPEEFARVREHPVLGERIVTQLQFMADSLPLIRGHHERPDGEGYPDGLWGEMIPLGARIIAVADAYVAMTSDRPHRRRKAPGTAVTELKQGKGTAYDGACVDALLAVLREEGVIDAGAAAERPS
jgi:putative nucleotidyltransferase with HDIG domain